MGNAANNWAKRKLMQLRQERGNNCEHPGCTSRTNLEFAHVRRTELTASGPRDRKAKACDIANHPSSYQLLCHKHHTLKHHAQHSRLTKQGIAKSQAAKRITRKTNQTNPYLLLNTPSLNELQNLQRKLRLF